MYCPNCKITVLVIQNNNYFCPNCKIYIGQVNSYKPPSPIILEKKIVDKRGLIKHYVFKGVIILVILIIINYFTQNLYYIDFKKGCFIGIIPSLHLEFSNSGIKRALAVVKNISPDNYKNICERVTIINTNISCGGFEGGCFEHSFPRMIYVTAPAREITWVAEVLAHEACHAKQAYEGRGGDESECHQVGLKVMQEATVY